jgi:hypothetical protein
MSRYPWRLLSYYHCIFSCVHRAFLCGVDNVNVQKYEYLRRWLEDRLPELARIFALDACAYAILLNHYHVVSHANGLRLRAGTRVRC